MNFTDISHISPIGKGLGALVSLVIKKLVGLDIDFTLNMSFAKLGKIAKYSSI